MQISLYANLEIDIHKDNKLDKQNLTDFGAFFKFYIKQMLKENFFTSRAKNISHKLYQQCIEIFLKFTKLNL